MYAYISVYMYVYMCAYVFSQDRIIYPFSQRPGHFPVCTSLIIVFFIDFM